MNENGKDKKLDWMYKGANSLVDREEYLLGRSVDKALEQLNAEEKEKKLGLVPPKNHVEHECIPPSIRDFNKIVQAEQVDISAKLQEDPLVAIKKREEEARRQFLQNPVQLKKLQEALKAQQLKKKNKKHKQSKNSDSDSDLDNKIVRKLKYLKEAPSASKKQKKKSKDSILDTILMHKFNQLKDKLSQEDLNNILAGNASDSDKEEKSKKYKNRKRSDSEGSDKERKLNKRERSNSTSSEGEKPRKGTGGSREVEGCSKYKRRIDESRKHIRELSRKQSEEKGKMFRQDTGYGRGRRSRSRDRNQLLHGSSSDEEVERIKNKHGKKSKEETNTHNESSTKDNRKKILDRRGSGDKYVDHQKHKSESDLETRILKKLRMLRDSVKSKENESSSTNGGTEGGDNNRKNTAIVKTKSRCKSSSDSSSDDSDSEKHPQKSFHEYDSDSDEHKNKPRTFGLVKSDGSKIALSKRPYEVKSTEKFPAKSKTVSKPEKKSVKRLTEEEKEKLRREMMINAEERDKERSDNLRRYREEDEREKRESGNFDKGFVHKQLLKSTRDATIETRIKSNLNNIQRSSRHMDSNFSRRK